MKTLVVGMSVALALASPAFAGKARDCKDQAAVVELITKQRRAGAKIDVAMPIVSASLSGRLEKYKEAVPPLADWIYSLPDDQIGSDVSGAYREACLAQ